MSDSTATLSLEGKDYILPIIVGTEQEKAFDISTIRDVSGYVTLDSGYKNTGATTSKITFLDGELGILRYRGYDIAEVADMADFVETSYLLLYGELPSATQLEQFSQKLKENSDVPPEVAKMLKAMPSSMHPMAQLAAVTLSFSGFFPKDAAKPTDETIITLLAKFPTLVAMVMRNFQGLDFIAPDSTLDYVSNFLYMAFGKKATPAVVDAMDKLLILHGDHEQNCSTSTVRMVGSSNANIYASVSGGLCALWGPLHGGANQAVLEQLEAIEADGGDAMKFVNLAKDKTSGIRLMGFGHRVYKSFDPRAKIIKVACDNVLQELGGSNKKLAIAKQLEAAALSDEYFITRDLYPNVDFYSGLIYNALDFPTEMFTPLFALGRIPGWVAQWKEMKENKEPISRPRQIYMGNSIRTFIKIQDR
jgi:citrate synthase